MRKLTNTRSPGLTNSRCPLLGFSADAEQEKIVPRWHYQHGSPSEQAVDGRNLQIPSSLTPHRGWLILRNVFRDQETWALGTRGHILFISMILPIDCQSLKKNASKQTSNKRDFPKNNSFGEEAGIVEHYNENRHAIINYECVQGCCQQGKGAMSMHITLWHAAFFSFTYIPSSGTAEYYSSSTFNFLSLLYYFL